jgi:ketosteroid isomerase-like protein
MTAQCLLDAKKALETLDLTKVASIYAMDFIFEDVPAGQRITDRARLEGYFTRLFSLPGVEFSDICIYDGGTFAALEWTWSGIHRMTGEVYHVRGASVIELRGGKIARESIYYDPSPAA